MPKSMHKSTQISMKKQLYIILIAVLLTVASLSAGCDISVFETDECKIEPTDNPVPITTVTHISYPDTVSEGDTVQVSVSIADTIDGFSYVWLTRDRNRPCTDFWLNTIEQSGGCETTDSTVSWVVFDVDSSRDFTINFKVKNHSLEGEWVYNPDYDHDGDSCASGYYSVASGYSFQSQILDSDRGL